MVETPHDSNLAAAGDIIFNCPFCAKSLAIDQRGAGMMVTCPDCGREIQVPDQAADADEAEAHPSLEVSAEALAAAHAKIERLVSSLEEVRERRRYLERLRVENIERFKQIGGELEIIQNAIDRIVGLLQDAAAEKLSEPESPPAE